MLLERLASCKNIVWVSCVLATGGHDVACFKIRIKGIDSNGRWQGRGQGFVGIWQSDGSGEVDKGRYGEWHLGQEGVRAWELLMIAREMSSRMRKTHDLSHTWSALLVVEVVLSDECGVRSWSQVSRGCHVPRGPTGTLPLNSLLCITFTMSKKAKNISPCSELITHSMIDS